MGLLDDAKNAVEGYYDMSDEAFARRFYADRAELLALGVPITDVFDALQSTMGALYVNDFNKFGRTYRVQVQAEGPYRASLEGLGNIHVRSATTREMIPLKALVRARNVVGPDQVDRFNGFVAAKMLAAGVPGISSGQAIAIVEEEAARMPEGFQVEWAGQAFQERRSGKQSTLAFGMALLMVFLILAANYERWSLPVAVLLPVPFAVLGALAVAQCTFLAGLQWAVFGLGDYGFGLADQPLAWGAAAAVLRYVEETQRSALAHVRQLVKYEPGGCLLIDAASRKNLDLLRNSADGRRAGSLIGTIDRTATAMGGRLLTHWLLYPLTDPAAINRPETRTTALKVFFIFTTSHADSFKDYGATTLPN